MNATKFLYVAGRKMDPNLFSDLLLRAKGADRTLTEFAGLCHVSTSTLSRIVNKGNTRASTVDLLRAIAENTADNSVTFAALMQANGYSRVEMVETDQPDFLRQPKQRNLPAASVRGQVHRRMYKANLDAAGIYSEILQSSLFDGSATFRTGEKVKYSFIAETDHLPEGLNGWAFDILEVDPDGVYEEYLKIFRRLYMLQPGDHHLKYTIIMQQEKTFGKLCSLFRNDEIRDPFSIMLIDEKKKTIVTEVVPK